MISFLIWQTNFGNFGGVAPLSPLWTGRHCLQASTYCTKAFQTAGQFAQKVFLVLER